MSGHTFTFVRLIKVGFFGRFGWGPGSAWLVVQIVLAVLEEACYLFGLGYSGVFGYSYLSGLIVLFSSTCVCSAWTISSVLSCLSVSGFVMDYFSVLYDVRVAFS